MVSSIFAMIDATLCRGSSPNWVLTGLYPSFFLTLDSGFLQPQLFSESLPREPSPGVLMFLQGCGGMP